MMSGPTRFQKTSLQLYRDCLRLVRHLTPGFSPKAVALRQTVRTQFEINRYLQDEAEVEAAKASAVRALANYMLFANAAKDSKVKPAMKIFHDKSVQEMASAAASAADDASTLSTASQPIPKASEATAAADQNY